MPVTARLSKKFYDTFGEDLAQELVDWFNQVDATYRADLRELNELNFARFDAKLEQRVAKLDAKLDQRVSELDAKLEQRVGELDAKLEQRVGELDAKLERRIAEVRADLAAQRAELIKWMFVFWAGTVVPLAALIVALHG